MAMPATTSTNAPGDCDSGVAPEVAATSLSGASVRTIVVGDGSGVGVLVGSGVGLVVMVTVGSNSLAATNATGVSNGGVAVGASVGGDVVGSGFDVTAGVAGAVVRAVAAAGADVAVSTAGASAGGAAPLPSIQRA